MGKIQKVVVNINVIISAFGWGGKPFVVIKLLEQHKIRNCISGHTRKELSAELAYSKHAFSHATQTNILEFVLAYSDRYEPTERISAAPDPDDNKFIVCVPPSRMQGLSSRATSDFYRSGDTAIFRSIRPRNSRQAGRRREAFCPLSHYPVLERSAGNYPTSCGALRS